MSVHGRDKTIFYLAKIWEFIPTKTPFDRFVVDDDLLCKIAPRCPRLVHVDMSINQDITDVGLGAIVAECPSLTSINFSHSLITDVVLKAIGERCPHLISIRLNNCIRITDDGIKAFAAANFPNLKKISLICCRNIGGDGIQTLQATYPALQILCESHKKHKSPNESQGTA